MTDTFRSLGTTGLQQVGGQIAEERLAELQGEGWRRAVAEMVNDPVIGGVLFAVEMLVRQVTWQVVPADKSPAAEAEAEFVRGALFEDLRPGWEDTLAEILSFLPWGWSFLEIVWKRRLGPDTADPTGQSTFRDGRIGVRKLAIRPQDTLLRWEWDAEGEVAAMVQSAAPTYVPVTIPRAKAALFRTTSRKGSPEGVSILRRAYRPWYFKRRIENVEGVGIERDLAGLPVAWVPPQLLSPTAPVEMQKAFDAIQKLVTGIRRDEQEGVVFPLAYDERGNKLYDLTLLSTGGERQFDTGKIVDRWNSQIAMTVLADFLTLGHEKVGSYALAGSKIDLFVVALDAWLDSIASVVNTDIVIPLMRLNAVRQALQPKVRPGRVQRRNLAELAAFLKELTDSGAPVWPNTPLLTYLLEEADLPAPDPEEMAAATADPEEPPEPADEGSPGSGEDAGDTSPPAPQRARGRRGLRGRPRATRAAEPLVPAGAGEALPPVPEQVEFTPAQINAALDRWDELMTGYEGLLDAEPVE